MSLMTSGSDTSVTVTYTDLLFIGTVFLVVGSYNFKRLVSYLSEHFIHYRRFWSWFAIFGTT